MKPKPKTATAVTDRDYPKLSAQERKRLSLIVQGTLQDLRLKRPAAAKGSKPIERRVQREWIN
jgi:hypothetical protein